VVFQLPLILPPKCPNLKVGSSTIGAAFEPGSGVSVVADRTGDFQIRPDGLKTKKSRGRRDRTGQVAGQEGRLPS